MATHIQAVRGMNDLLPEVTPLWQQIEHAARQLLNAYGYREIRIPIVEKTELYARSIGQVTDIVEKEMYTFEDRNGDSLSLRPEGTAGCVRAGIENGILHNQTQRLWYIGPMFRHEKPQKGRYRQFHQIGVEAFGLVGPDIDAELIALSARLWRQLGIAGLDLQINSLGTSESRARYRTDLSAYLRRHGDALDDDSKRRLETNPLRVLDSKNPAMRDIVAGAPQLLDYLDDESRDHFERLCRALERTGIAYTINPRLVRGLDYYSRTVFEWVANAAAAQGTVCAGGRYDGLVEQLGGKPTPAIGFAIGLERLVDLLPEQCLQDLSAWPHVYVLAVGATAEAEALGVAEALRDRGLRVLLHCGGGNLKNQMKKADRSGARFAVIIGEDELRAQFASVKDLRADTEQTRVKFSDVAQTIAAQLPT